MAGNYDPTLREFMQYVDIAPYIDRYGTDVLYNIAFDIKSESIAQYNNMQVYCQNGTSQKYNIKDRYSGVLNFHIPVTEEFEHKNIITKTARTGQNVSSSWLAFYGGNGGTYGNGNIPHVKNLRFDLGEGYESGEIISSDVVTNSQLNLYAKWIPKSVTLPIPTKEGYTFLGWYTEKEGGTKISNTFTPQENITLYAHWLAN